MVDGFFTYICVQWWINYVCTAVVELDMCFLLYCSISETCGIKRPTLSRACIQNDRKIKEGVWGVREGGGKEGNGQKNRR